MQNDTGFPIKDARSLKNFLFDIFKYFTFRIISEYRLGIYSILRNGRLFRETLYNLPEARGRRLGLKVTLRYIFHSGPGLAIFLKIQLNTRETLGMLF